VTPAASAGVAGERQEV